MLNAKQHDREAAIVAQAGRKGAVTVATNMAGRGTDIMLGGNVEFLAHDELRQRGLTRRSTPRSTRPRGPTRWSRPRRPQAEHDEVAELGGLYVLGTERHESRRIDNQLRGRSGRQGDPGESRFYLSLGDDLMRLFKAPDRRAGADPAQRPGRRADRVQDGHPRDRAPRSRQVEQQNFEIRKNVLKYDEVLNKQRMVIYDERRRVLEGEDLRDQIQHFIEETIDAYVARRDRRGLRRGLGPGQAVGRFRQLYPIEVTVEELEEAAGDRAGLTAELIAEAIKDDVHDQYDGREAQLGDEVMRELERRVVLSVLDRKWREHLYEMDYLREGIGLRAMAQRDPLVEYQREGFDLFKAMMEGIREESVGYIFNVEVQVEQQVEEVPVEDTKPVADLEKQDAVPAQAPAPARRSAPRGSTSRSGATCTSPRRRSTVRAAPSRWPAQRELLSRGGNAYVRLLLGIDVRDATAGFRLFRRATLDKIDLRQVRSTGYVFQTDMVARTLQAGLTVREVPIEFVERIRGESKMSPAVAAESLRRITSWGLRERVEQLRRSRSATGERR